MLMMEKVFNMKAYLPSREVKDNLKKFFANVTMPVYEDFMNEVCGVKVASDFQFHNCFHSIPVDKS